jgi:hypothetical protein
MTKVIQTRVDADGDVHLDFSGFVGRDCQLEEDRFRRELAALGLAGGVKVAPKLANGASGCSQSPSGFRIKAT